MSSATDCLRKHGDGPPQTFVAKSEAFVDPGSVIESIPPALASVRSLGVQVIVVEAVKERLETEAQETLQKLGEALLDEVIREGHAIAVLDGRKQELFPRLRSGDIVRAFDRTIVRLAQRGGRKPRVWNYLHELPVLGFGAASAQAAEAWRTGLFSDLAIAFGTMAVSILLQLYFASDC